MPTHGPKFVSIEVDYPTQGFYDQIASVVEGNFVTVKRLPPGYNDLGAIEQHLLDVGARHVEFSTQTQFPAMPPSLEEVEPELSLVTAVEEYVDNTETALDKPQLVGIGVQILNVAGNTVERGDKDIDAAFNDLISQDS